MKRSHDGDLDCDLGIAVSVVDAFEGEIRRLPRVETGIGQGGNRDLLGGSLWSIDGDGFSDFRCGIEAIHNLNFGEFCGHVLETSR